MAVMIREDVPDLLNAEQSQLLSPLLSALRTRRWINEDALVALELPWNGRRIDVATLSSSGRTAAYELKLGAFHRVLEQAMYNRLAFDRSWAVVDAVPRSANLLEATENGVGVLLVRQGQLTLLSRSIKHPVTSAVRSRLRSTFERAQG